MACHLGFPSLLFVASKWTTCLGWIGCIFMDLEAWLNTQTYKPIIWWFWAHTEPSMDSSLLPQIVHALWVQFPPNYLLIGPCCLHNPMSGLRFSSIPPGWKEFVLEFEALLIRNLFDTATLSHVDGEAGLEFMQNPLNGETFMCQSRQKNPLWIEFLQKYTGVKDIGPIEPIDHVEYKLIGNNHLVNSAESFMETSNVCRNDTLLTSVPKRRPKL